MAADAARSTPVIEVRDLVIRHGDLTAVDGLSLRAHPGEVLALLGPNGAGKTSTVEVLEGYRRPDGGTVRVLGLDPVRQHRQLVAGIGVMPQDGGIANASRPRELLDLYATYYDDPRPSHELLSLIGLADRATTTYRNLSGGEQQRLSLGLALVGRPTVAFLDEPTAGIDPAGRRRIRRIVADLRAEGVCVLLTSHDLDEVERLADQVVIVDRGKMVADGPPGELMADGGTEIRFGAPPGLDVASLAERLGAAVTEADPGEYVVATAPSPRAVASVTAWLADHDLPLSDLRAGRQRLEDVFLRLTSGSVDDDPDRDDGQRSPRRTPRRRGRRA